MENRKEQEQQAKRRLPGFYIALCCCVIAIGVAGYFTEKATDKQHGGETALNSAESTDPDTVEVNGVVDNIPKDTEKKEEAPVLEYVPDTGAVNTADNAVFEAAKSTTDDTTDDTREAAETAVESDNTGTYTADNAATVTESAGTGTESAEATALIVSTPSFARPAEGEILSGFSRELAYNAALCDWRCHNGVDIAVDSGASVTAAADGTVKEISSDEMGSFVVIDHNNGFQSKYRGLSSVEDMNAGDEVKSGAVIGIVTASKGENTTEPHLHFELSRDGTLVNPEEYME